MLKKASVILIAILAAVCICAFPVSAATMKGEIWTLPDEGELSYCDTNGLLHTVHLEKLSHRNTVDGSKYINLPVFHNYNYPNSMSGTYYFAMQLKEPIYVTANDLVKLSGMFSLSLNVATSHAYLYEFRFGFGGESTTESNRYFSGILGKSGPVYMFSGDRDFEFTGTGFPEMKITYISMYCQFIFSSNLEYQAGASIGFKFNDVTLRYGTQSQITSDINQDKTNETLGEVLTVQNVISTQLDDIEAQQQAINNNMQSMLFEQQATNEKLDDLLAQPEQEKQEASSSGDSNVDALTSVIPDYSTGFITGMKKLGTSLSYNGTDCKWKFPQLYIPAMKGVSGKIELTDGEMEIDIGSWVQKLPTTILKVIRILLTAALILYCVRELYATVQYALTLKGGGGA